MGPKSENENEGPMKIHLKIISLIAILFSTQVSATQSIGFYSKGSIENSENILDKNYNLIKLYIERKKLFTSNDMLALLNEIVSFRETKFPSSELIQVGDLSGQNGGEAKRHTSHQNGLDADIVYFRVNEKAQDQSNPEWAENFIVGKSVSKNFHAQRNYDLLKFIAGHGNVERIFVDPLIKKELCKISKTNGDISSSTGISFLRKIRPASLHQTHFHVRLSCPKGNLKCLKQDPPPAGHGCSESDLMQTDDLKNLPTC